MLIVFLGVAFACTGGPRPKTDPDVPYLPTPANVVYEMLRLASVSENDTVYDLGCGDGRVVIAAARDFNARAVGVEIDAELVEKSITNAAREGVSGKVRFLREDIFRADIRDAQVVTLYLLPGVNVLLIPKLFAELKPGARIVSHMHDMGDWLPDKTVRVGDSTVYLWVLPADIDGTWDVIVHGTGGPASGTLSFSQSFQVFHGTIFINGKKVRLYDTNLNGTGIFFSSKSRAAGVTQITSFQGVVKDGTIEGQLVSGSKDSKEAVALYRWTAKRRNVR